LHLACSERHILSVSPLRLDQLPGFERQEIADPEVAHGNGDIQFHRKQRYRQTEDRRFNLFPLPWRDRDKSLPASRLIAADCCRGMGLCVCRRWEWLCRRHLSRNDAE
jgi:hypothetical protein